MTDIYSPFAAILPSAEKAKDIAAPPYDVLSTAEARELAKDNPLSFLHISKAEIDLEENISPYDARVYQKAKENFCRLLKSGALYQKPTPGYYIYRLKTDSHTQTGIAVAASVKAYNEGRIKRHELTRTAKEDDRVRQIKAVGAQTGPALLINKPIAEIKTLLSRICEETKPLFSVTAEHDVQHTLWLVDNQEDIAAVTRAFNVQNEAYIADGHHRTAAAARLAAENGNSEEARFLAVAFFADEMKIWDYNRVVYDLNGLSESEFLQKIKARGFSLSPSEKQKPAHKGQFKLYLNKKWYTMEQISPEQTDDPVKKLDVSVLSAEIFAAILNITDLRHSERIDFIGGIRGADEIERLTDAAPNRAGFMVYPTSTAELLAVADKNLLMPPKSTWFEPKLADGIITLNQDN